MRHTKALFMACAVAAGFAPLASAESILVVRHPVITTVGSNRQFDYDVTLDAGNTVLTGSTLLSGDYFTIYDFQGFNGVVSLPAGWTPISLPTGVTPADQLMVGLNDDDPTLPNVTFVYTGTPFPGSPTALPDDIDLGHFVLSTSVLVGINDSEKYVGQDHAMISSIPGDPSSPKIPSPLPSGNSGTTDVPFNVHGPHVAPLPLTSIGGVALMGLVAGGRRIRRAKRN